MSVDRFVDRHLRSHTKLSSLLCMAGTTGLEPATSAVTVSVKLVTLSNQTARMAPFDALRHPWERLLCPYCARSF